MAPMTPEQQAQANTAMHMALSRVGGQSALGRLLGIKQPSIAVWRAVPVRWVLEVERLTGIRRTKLRPDIYPPRK